jgi:hypothetical protein
MAIDVALYNEGILLGTGSQTTTSISSYSGTAPGNGRNVQVVNVTAAGATLGRSWQSRVVSGSGTATLTMNRAAPYA